MKKYILPTSVIVLAFFTYSLSSMYGASQGKSIPKKINKTHAATIEQVDAFIIAHNLENEGGITSYDDNFNLELYLKTLQIGVYTILDNGDPLKDEVEILIESILKHID